MRSTVHIAPNLSAAKALLNMDEASRKHGVYDSSTYLLHPLTGVTQSLPDVIIFDVVYYASMINKIYFIGGSSLGRGRDICPRSTRWRGLDLAAE